MRPFLRWLHKLRESGSVAAGIMAAESALATLAAEAKSEETTVAKRRPKTIRVLYHKAQQRWYVKCDGGLVVLLWRDTRMEAFLAARKIARAEKLELVIHGRDGRIRDARSYGPDPRRRKG